MWGSNSVFTRKLQDRFEVDIVLINGVEQASFTTTVRSLDELDNTIRGLSRNLNDRDTDFLLMPQGLYIPADVVVPVVPDPVPPTAEELAERASAELKNKLESLKKDFEIKYITLKEYEVAVTLLKTPIPK